MATHGTFAAERVGVSAVSHEFSRQGWAFREQPIADFGIDAHVEPFFGGKPTGRLIALQIKSGSSYFGEPAVGGWVFRDSDTHLLYWLRHSLPVVLLLHDPDADVTYWEHVTRGNVEFTDGGWKMLVPALHVLNQDAMEDFRKLAESAPGAGDDPVEASCGLLPPTTAAVLRDVQAAEPSGAMRLAALLAQGRATPRLTAESVLSGAPSWLPRGNGKFEIAVATYASEHGHPDLASEAFARAAAYSGQPTDLLLGYAALEAAQAADASRARKLLAQITADPASSLLLATVDAVVRHLGTRGPVPIPDALTAATPAARAAEPTCLAFLGVQALQRRDAMGAVRYFEEGHAAHPEGTALMLQLAQALQLRVGMGRSAVPAEDLRRIELLTRGALEQRRRWSGPSSQALAMLIARHAQVGAFEEALRLAGPAPDGAAVGDEAFCDEVVILGVQLALILGDAPDQAAMFASRARSDHARTVVTALCSDPDLPTNEKADLWRAVLANATQPDIQMLAWHRLACLGVWPLPDAEELRAAGQLDIIYYDVLKARAMAAGGDLDLAVSYLRSRAADSPLAAEALVDLLQEAGRFDEALDQAERGFQRFGEAVLAHKQLNLLVLADQPDAAADEAMRLLARPDTAPELRLRTYRRLIGHHAFRRDWPTVEQLSRTALSEFTEACDLQWSIIGAAHNQGRLNRAQEYYEQFVPEISTVPQAGLWMSLRMHTGFSQADVSMALDLLDRWPDDAFETQVLQAFLGAAARRTPEGRPILPDLDPDSLQRFHARLLAYPSRQPGGAIQSLSPDPNDLADMLRAQLAPQAERTEIVQRLIREGRLWLGALAAMLGRPYAQALIMRTCGVILAVTPDPPEFEIELHAAHTALDQAVIIDSSALAVATTIPGRWPQLCGTFTELHYPRDAWSDVQAAQHDLLRDPDAHFSITYDNRRDILVRHQLTQAEHEYLGRRVRDINDALQDLTVVPAPDLGPFADYSPASTDPALSPLALAAQTGMPLWCDDVVLRALAREHGIRAFGTLALLDALTETGRLPDTMREDVLHLARAYTTDLMLTPEELLNLAAENSYHPGPASAVLRRPVFWAAPVAAQNVLLELVTHVHAQAPQTLIAWFQAACTGLAARQPESSSTERARTLAETICRHIHADDDLRAQLIEAANGG